MSPGARRLTRPWTHSGRALAALLALGVGWLTSDVLFFVYVLRVDGRLTDVFPWLFWTGVFVLAGWAGFVLPIVWLVNPRHWVFHPPWAPLVGATAGSLALTLLLGVTAAASPAVVLETLPGWIALAAVTGSVGWTVYCRLIARDEGVGVNSAH